MSTEPSAATSAGEPLAPHRAGQDAEASIAHEILRGFFRSDSPEAFLNTVLPPILAIFQAPAGGLVVQRLGQWTTAAWSGESASVPEERVSEAIDHRQVSIDEFWWIVPLGDTSIETAIPSVVGDETTTADLTASAFVFRAPQSESTHSASDARRPGTASRRSAAERRDPQADRAAREHLVRLASWMTVALQRLRWQVDARRRVNQLRAALDAAARWQQLDDDASLLRAIADTATELLDCERASIFLWDRRRKKLVGRPALGIDGDALEVDDDAGVVGEVLGSGEATLWNAGDDDERRINRSVDRSHHFETRSLLAVPLSSRQDQVIGVFEAINHRQGGFDHSDTAVLKDLATHAAVTIEAHRTRRSLAASRDRLVDDAASATQLIGSHGAIEQVRATATKVAKTDLTVMVLGENGTGKEVLARHIHFQSNRRNAPFVAVNCAALVESLLESELFGHEQGAFTDAHETRAGKFELASGGTLFLDEVGDMSPGGQAKLLRVLEEKVVVRVGGSRPIPVDVRVIAATNQQLDSLIAEKRFREDLFFRLNVVSLTLPPLSERGDDVIQLAEHFLEQFSHQVGRPVPQLEKSAREALLSHRWPGNIRELRNTIERVCYLCGGDSIVADDLLLASAPAVTRADTVTGAAERLPESLGEATRQFQITRIQRAITACRGNMTDAAARLGLHRSNLYRKMRQLGMDVSSD